MSSDTPAAVAGNDDNNNNNNTIIDGGEPEEIDPAIAELQLREEAEALRAGLEDLFDHIRMALDDADHQLLSTSASSSSSLIEEQFMMLISQYSNDALARACLIASADTQRLPIHLACEYSAPVPVIRYLLDNSDIAKTSILAKDKWGDLPIHIACSRSSSTFGPAVVKLLLESDLQKQTLFVKDCNDYLPIHMACRYLAPPYVIEQLLESDDKTNKSSLFQEGIHGQYPIHIACRSDASPEIVKLLLQDDDELKSVLKEDDGGRLPIHVYLVRHRNEDVVKLLLQTMIGGRMERLGLENWKGNMYSLLKSLSGTYERDFMTREKLDVISEALKGFMERAFLLELAVWRESCLHEDNNEHGFSSMSDIDELGRKDVTFDPNEYRQARRIKSGAEVIVRDVLPFLEEEPINEILKQLKDFK